MLTARPRLPAASRVAGQIESKPLSGYGFALAAVTVAAALLRLVPFLANYPLHLDEGLYGYWARLVATGQDPLLLTPWIDKPPFSIYLIAASFRAFGFSEWSLRLPGMIAGILLVPAVYLLAQSVYGHRVALLAALLVAASPFAMLFAPTAFTDPWLTLWMVAALLAALTGRPLAAGLATGLAVASKQQGVLVVPLVLAALLLLAHSTGKGAKRSGTSGSADAAATTRRSREPRHAANFALRFAAALLGFAVVFAPLTYWDSLRWSNRPSFWDRSLTTYAPLTVAPLAQLGERIADWAQQFGYLWGHPGITAAVFILSAWAVVWRLLPRQRRGYSRPVTGRNRHGETLDLILGAFVAGYIFLHVVVTFQPWDRYLLPLVPLLCILAARGCQRLRQVWGAWRDNHPRCTDSRALRQSEGAAAILAAVVLLSTASMGAAGRLPVGSDHGAYAGLERGIARLAALPADAVIYHHSLGWYYDFYLYESPQERRWYGTGWKLADDAAVTHGREQWLLLPEWEMSWLDDMRMALAGHGLALAEWERIRRPDGSLSFVLYRIVSLDGRPA